MTRNATKARKCDGKRRHDNQEAALAVIRRHVEQGAAPGRLSAYQCEHCGGGWHVGHTPRQTGRRRKT